jgi:hypothetical protein
VDEHLFSEKHSRKRESTIGDENPFLEKTFMKEGIYNLG